MRPEDLAYTLAVAALVKEAGVMGYLRERPKTTAGIGYGLSFLPPLLFIPGSGVAMAVGLPKLVQDLHARTVAPEEPTPTDSVPAPQEGP